MFSREGEAVVRWVGGGVRLVGWVGGFVGVLVWAGRGREEWEQERKKVERGAGMAAGGWCFGVAALDVVRGDGVVCVSYAG